MRCSLAVDGDRVSAAGFDADGCGAMLAAGSAAVELVEGAGLLDAARIGSPQIAAELGGLSAGKLHAADLAADALHRALGAAVRSTGALAADPARTLVAMSGGVDSAVAALLAAASRRRGRAVTLELWRDADNDGERSCCSAAAVRGARALAHELGLPHFTLDLRDGVPRRRRRAVAGRARRRADAQPVRALQRPRPPRRDARRSPTGSAPRRWRPATTRAYRRTGCCALAADPAKDQTYMLAALGRRRSRRLRFPLGELTKPEVRAIARAAGLPVAAKPDSQDLCFLAGTGRAAFLARHGDLRERPGDVVDRGGRVLGRHRGHHRYTVGQRRGLGDRRRRAALRPRDRRARQHRHGRPARGSATTTSSCATSACTARRRASTRVQLRYHAPALRCRLDGDIVALDEPVDGAAPGQTAVLLRGDASSDARQSPDAMGMTSDEIRETFLSFFEQRDHLRLPSASLVPATFDPSVLLTTAGMHPLKPYFRGEETPPHPRLTTCQKCFRTTDIENVGNTTRHLTFFEMLGNFSIGDYFKQGAVELAWELSLEGFGFDPDDIWITVFEGDEELGLGPDEEAIEAWESIGVPRERIVLCPRSENFWQAGRQRPVRPVQRAVLRPRPGVGHARRPARRRERALPRVLEPRLHAVRPRQDAGGTMLTPLPARTSTPAWASTAWRSSSRASTRSSRPTSSRR